MKRIRLNPFDALFIFFAAALLFTIAFNISEDRSHTEPRYAVLLMEREKVSGQFAPGDRVNGCGIYEMEIIGISDGHFLLLAEGKCKDGGFLIGGTKYICANQPFSFSEGGRYAGGRIERTVYISGEHGETGAKGGGQCKKTE